MGGLHGRYKVAHANDSGLPCPSRRDGYRQGKGRVPSSKIVVESQELAGDACARPIRSTEVYLLDAVRGSRRIVVGHVDEETEDEALRWPRRHDEREYSFVDATSFIVMRRRRLTEALAFDGDYKTAGFVEVRAQPS